MSVKHCTFACLLPNASADLKASSWVCRRLEKKKQRSKDTSISFTARAYFIISCFLDLNIETGYKTLWCDHSQRRNLGEIFIFCILKVHKFWTFLWTSIKGILGVLRLKFDCFLFLLRECHICNLAVLPSNQACLGKACWKLNNTCLLYVTGSFTLHNL